MQAPLRSRRRRGSASDAVSALTACVSRTSAAREVVARAVPSMSDDELLDLARAATFHRVAGLVHQTLRDLDLPPSTALDMLAAERARAVQSHLVKLRSLGRVSALLSDAGIPVIVMKGP